MDVVECRQLPFPEHCDECHAGDEGGWQPLWEEDIGEVTYRYCCAGYVKIKLMAALWKDDYDNDGHGATPSDEG